MELYQLYHTYHIWSTRCEFHQNVEFAQTSQVEFPGGSPESVMPLAFVKSDNDNYIPRRRSIAASNTKATKRIPRRRTHEKDRFPWLSRKNDMLDAERRFPCPLAFYGCTSTFSSKNEMKRHVSISHIRFCFWCCDLCTPTVDSRDNQTLYYNDFNRKDLFTQHLRRMHSQGKGQTEGNFLVNEHNIAEHQRRCLRKVREPPSRSSCIFCPYTFSGPGSWESGMEHVGRHLEMDRKQNTPRDFESLRNDPELEKYLIDEGVITQNQDGGWRISDGATLRLNRAKGK